MACSLKQVRGISIENKLKHLTSTMHLLHLDGRVLGLNSEYIFDLFKESSISRSIINRKLSFTRFYMKVEEGLLDNQSVKCLFYMMEDLSSVPRTPTNEGVGVHACNTNDGEVEA